MRLIHRFARRSHTERQCLKFDRSRWSTETIQVFEDFLGTFGRAVSKLTRREVTTQTPGILISGLMRSGSGQAAPSAPQTSPANGGGGIGDILRNIFEKGMLGAGAPTPSTTPSSSPPQDRDIGG